MFTKMEYKITMMNIFVPIAYILKFYIISLTIKLAYHYEITSFHIELIKQGLLKIFTWLSFHIYCVFNWNLMVIFFQT